MTAESKDVTVLAEELSGMANPSDGPSTASEVSTPQAPEPSKREKRKMRLQQASMVKMFKTYQEKQKKNQRKLRAAVDRMRRHLDKEDYNNLKDICTIRTEEKKADDGTVLEKATAKINYYALLIEGKHLLVLQREARIKAGFRKKTTGRQSQRKAHRSMVNFLNNRNVKTVETEVVHT